MSWEASRLKQHVPKVVYTSSIGAYRSAEIFHENENLEGPPMDLYPGWAKRMAELQIKAYQIQYGLKNYAVVRPCNVYGPGDNFDPENAMVIQPSCTASYERRTRLSSGATAARSGISLTAATWPRALSWPCTTAPETGSSTWAAGTGVSIRELVETLHSFLNFNYRFDTEKPSGFPRRVMDISLARERINYRPKTSLRDGLQITRDWYVKHQDEFLEKKNYFKE